MAKKKGQEGMRKEISLPEGVSAEATGTTIKFKGPKGEVTKNLDNPRITLAVKDSNVIIESKKATQREKKLIGSFSAHAKNAINCVNEGHIYKMKICSGHFPMTVSVNNNLVQIKNFLGEKTPRKIQLVGDISVKVEGTDVVIESSDKDAAGIAASKLEKLTKRQGFDKRIFQDGLYIYMKDGKMIK